MKILARDIMDKRFHTLQSDMPIADAVAAFRDAGKQGAAGTKCGRWGRIWGRCPETGQENMFRVHPIAVFGLAENHTDAPGGDKSLGHFICIG